MDTTSLADDFLAQLQGAPMQQLSAQLGASPQQTSAAVGAALPMLLGALGRNAASPQGADALLGALQRDHGGMDLGSVLGGVLGQLGGLGGAGGAGPAMGAAPGGGGLGDLLGAVLGGGRAAGGGTGGLGDVLGGLLGGAQGGQAGTALPGRRGDLDGLLGHIFGGQQQRAESGLGQATGLGSTGAQMLLKALAPMVMAFLAQRFLQGGGSAGGGNSAGSAGDLSQALGQERDRLGRQGGLGGGLMSAVLDQDGDGDVDINDLLKLGGSLLGGRR